MDTPRLALVVFLLVFLFLSPNSRVPSLSQQRELEDSIQEERHALDILNTSSYGGLDAANGRWLNVTGLRHGDGYAWASLPKVQERAKEQLQSVLDAFGNPSHFENGSLALIDSDPGDDSTSVRAEAVLSSMKPFHSPAPIYQNVTGIVRGTWTRSQVEQGIVAPSLNLSTLAPRIGYVTQNCDRNITGSSGDLRIQIEEQNSKTLSTYEDFNLARNVKVQMTIKDESSSGDGWEITLHGVHYPMQGGLVLSTTSEK